MSIEIEKKYRLTPEEREQVNTRLRDSGAEFLGEEFEENTLYAGGIIDLKNHVLRLRRAGGKSTLTYKKRFASTSAIKHQLEEETVVEDPNAMSQILSNLGFRPVLVYEKRRATWRFPSAEVVVDELPFGIYLEIEGPEDAIIATEKALGLEKASSEMATYPQLTTEKGIRNGELIEARF